MQYADLPAGIASAAEQYLWREFGDHAEEIAKRVLKEPDFLQRLGDFAKDKEKKKAILTFVSKCRGGNGCRSIHAGMFFADRGFDHWVHATLAFRELVAEKASFRDQLPEEFGRQLRLTGSAPHRDVEMILGGDHRYDESDLCAWIIMAMNEQEHGEEGRLPVRGMNVFYTVSNVLVEGFWSGLERKFWRWDATPLQRHTGYLDKDRFDGHNVFSRT